MPSKSKFPTSKYKGLRLDGRRKLDWLLDHPQFWQGYRFGPRSKSKRILFQMMQASGLYSYKTNWFDSHVDSHVKRARQFTAAPQIEDFDYE